MNGRIRRSHRATQAFHRSLPESAPELGLRSSSPAARILEPEKIREINKKGRPYPPKSRAAISMVALVCPENACINRFDEDSSKKPKHGKPRFSRSASQTM